MLNMNNWFLIASIYLTLIASISVKFFKVSSEHYAIVSLLVAAGMCLVFGIKRAQYLDKQLESRIHERMNRKRKINE
jgi:hypothetical protein